MPRVVTFTETEGGWRAPGAGGGEAGSDPLTGTVSAGEDAKVPEMDGGDGCTVM